MKCEIASDRKRRTRVWFMDKSTLLMTISHKQCKFGKSRFPNPRRKNPIDGYFPIKITRHSPNALLEAMDFNRSQPRSPAEISRGYRYRISREGQLSRGSDDLGVASRGTLQLAYSQKPEPSTIPPTRRGKTNRSIHARRLSSLQ